MKSKHFDVAFLMPGAELRPYRKGMMKPTIGALLGRALEQRATRNTGRLTIANQVTNTSKFRAWLRQSAEMSAQGLENLREMSPVPTDVKPGQKSGSR